MEREIETYLENIENKNDVIANVSVKNNRVRFELIAVIVSFAAIYAVLISFFTPSLMLSPTTTSGGDTGAHIYVADYLLNHLLPIGRITGWSPGWYAGFPMLYFYFPFPFLVIAALSFIIKFQIAFKIGTVLGIFLLPLASYGAFQVLGYRFPLPIIAAGASLPFLFMESYSIYGGNIMSALAGEFGYSLSFALSILFLAVLYRDVKEQKFRVSTAVLLAVMVLSHIVTTIMVVIFSSYYLINRLNLKRLGILTSVFGLAFVLTAFWSMPFVDKISYTAHMQWDQLSGLTELFPYPVQPFLLLSAVGLLGALSTKDNRIYLFVWTTVVSISLFFLLPPGRLWNGRVLPYTYYFTFIWAAYGIWFLRKVLASLFYRVTSIPKRYADYLTMALVIATIPLIIFNSEDKVADWIQWNYSGYEGKSAWKDFDHINEYIKGLKQGRVMVEHSTDIDVFGTPRAFELLPYFADHATMEGTLMEASISAPFHFVNQAELSDKPSWAILGVQYPSRNVADGVRHMQLFNIRYFLALTNVVKDEANANKDLKLLKTFKSKDTDLKFSLYEVNTMGYVTIPKYKPVLVRTDNWRDTALHWYSNPELMEVPILDAAHTPDQLKSFKTIPANLRSKMPHEKLSNGKIDKVLVGDDSISFTTTAIGVPHLIKISYFPNWKATGADGPYLVSPSLMMVIPKQRHVSLHFGYTVSDLIGRWLSLIAWMLVIIYGLTYAIYRTLSYFRTRSAETKSALTPQELGGDR